MYTYTGNKFQISLRNESFAVSGKSLGSVFEKAEWAEREKRTSNKPCAHYKFDRSASVDRIF